MRTSADVSDEADSQTSSAMTTSLFLDSLYFTAYFGGLKGIFQAVLCRIPLLGRLACWIDRDHEWIGRIVESHGDRASLDGCTFFLGHPVIPTSLKKSFYYRPLRKERALRSLEILERTQPGNRIGREHRGRRVHYQSQAEGPVPTRRRRGKSGTHPDPGGA